MCANLHGGASLYAAGSLSGPEAGGSRLLCLWAVPAIRWVWQVHDQPLYQGEWERIRSNHLLTRYLPESRWHAMTVRWTVLWSWLRLQLVKMAAPAPAPQFAVIKGLEKFHFLFYRVLWYSQKSTCYIHRKVLVIFTEKYECFALLFRTSLKGHINLFYIIVQNFIIPDLSFTHSDTGQSWSRSRPSLHCSGSSQKARLRLHNSGG